MYELSNIISFLGPMHINLGLVWYVCLNNSFQFFWKYVWMKKCVEIHVMLFENWKYIFKIMYQTRPNIFNNPKIPIDLFYE